MSIAFKKVIKILEKEMGDILIEKGFKYDTRLSGGDTVSYTKYNEKKQFEEIKLCKAYLEPFIKVSISSNIRGGFLRLDRLAKEECRMRWPITTIEDTKKSVREITKLLNKYAWDWFTLAD